MARADTGKVHKDSELPILSISSRHAVIELLCAYVRFEVAGWTCSLKTFIGLRSGRFTNQEATGTASLGTGFVIALPIPKEAAF